jgi:hypothetical protein
MEMTLREYPIFQGNCIILKKYSKGKMPLNCPCNITANIIYGISCQIAKHF